MTCASVPLFQGHPAKIIPVWMICLSWLLFSSGCGSTPPRPEPLRAGEYVGTIDYLRTLIQGEMEDSRTQSLSIALIDDQRILWSEGFGEFSAKTRERASAQTLYRAGSITKLFTAVAVLKLREQGKIGLDEPVSAYLPGFNLKSAFADSATEPVTARNLLTHHAGMPRDRWKGALVPTPEEAPLAFAKRPGLVSGEYRIAPANAMFSYSNLGFSLLGNIVSAAAGIPYQDYLRDSILAPLGMARSSVVFMPEWEAGMAKAKYKDREIGGSDLNIVDLSAGSLYTNVQDLGRFMSMVFAGGESGGKRILARASLDSMLTRQHPGLAADEKLEIGMGFFLGRLPLGGADSAGLFVHSGSVPGFNSIFIGSRDLKLGVVVLANGGSAQEIASKALVALAEARLGRRIPDNPVPKPMKEISLDSSGLDGFTGRYGISLERYDVAEAEITRKGKRLKVLINGHLKETLYPTGPGTFRIQYDLWGFIPYRPRGNGLYMRRLDDARWVVGEVGREPIGIAERLVDGPVSQPWRDRAGRYACINPDADLFYRKDSLALEYQSRAGRLYCRWNRSAPRPLKIVSDLEALTYGKTEAIRVGTEDGKEFIEYSGYRFARIP